MGETLFHNLNSSGNHVDQSIKDPMKHDSIQVDFLLNEYVMLKEKVAMAMLEKKVKIKSCTSSAYLP